MKGFFENLTQGEVLDFRVDEEGGFNLWRGERKLWENPVGARTRAKAAGLCMDRLRELNAELAGHGLRLEFQTGVGEGGRRLRPIANKWLAGRVPRIDPGYLSRLCAIRLVARRQGS